jgi:hypothetical protein
MERKVPFKNGIIKLPQEFLKGYCQFLLSSLHLLATVHLSIGLGHILPGADAPPRDLGSNL